MEYKGKKIRESDEERFWNRVDIRGKDECWEWQAGKNSNKEGFNYGIFWLSGIGSILSHRLALSYHLGRLVECDEVMHSCDNPPCCNPFHLMGGTHKQNMEDRSAKGRVNPSKGVDRYNAKLDDDKVRKIRKWARLRAKYMKYTREFMARLFGVDGGVIAKVIKRTAWGHVED